MKIKGLVGVVLLSAGFVPALHSEKVTTKVFMQNPKAKLTYFIDTGTADVKWQDLKHDKTIKYDDSNSIKTLRVKRPSDSEDKAQGLRLLDKAAQENKVIVVSESGLGYWTKDAWETYKNSQSKRRSRM